MDANFFYYSIYDRCIQRQPCGCSRAFVNFFFKQLQKLFAGFLPFSQECSLDSLIEVKSFSSLLQKNQACGAIQALKRLYSIVFQMKIYFFLGFMKDFCLLSKPLMQHINP